MRMPVTSPYSTCRTFWPALFATPPGARSATRLGARLSTRLRAGLRAGPGAQWSAALWGALIASLCAAVLAPAPALARPPADAPRVLLLPFSAPPELATLAQRLNRVTLQGLRNQVFLLEPSPASLSTPPEQCVYLSACADALLVDYAAGALIFARIEPDVSSQPSPRVLVTLLAPDWPVAYIERRSTPDDARVLETARLLLMIGLGKVLPDEGHGEPTDERSPDRGPGGSQEGAALVTEPRSLAASIEAAGDGSSPADGAGDGSAKAPKKRWSLFRRAPKKPPPSALEGLGSETELDRALPADGQASTSRKKKTSSGDKRTAQAPPKKEVPLKPKKPPLLWPQLKPAGEWLGLSFELNGVAASGGLSVHMNSQLAMDESGAIVDRYRWAQREEGVAGGVQLSLGWNPKPWLEVGVEATLLTGRQRMDLSTYYAAAIPAISNSFTQGDFHLLAGGHLRYVLPLRKRVRPYLGAGAQAWRVPGYQDIPLELANHDAFGPYFRLGIDGQVGLRVLVTSRVFVHGGVRYLVDPGAALFEEIPWGNLGIALKDLNPPGTPSVAFGSLNLGVGGLF